MDYNHMQIEAAKKLLSKKSDGSNANLKARQDARHLLRSVSEDFVQFAMLKPRSRPAQYLMAEANYLVNVCELSFYGDSEPTEKNLFLDAHEIDLLDKETIVKMLETEDYHRFTRYQLAQALHRKLNIEDALGE